MRLLFSSFGKTGLWGWRVNGYPFPFLFANHSAILCNLKNLFLGFKKKSYFCDAAKAVTYFAEPAI